MKDSTGNPEFSIWLIGDSPPERWVDKLDTPLDPRHPARHSIWTSVADPMQDKLYRQRKLRLDTSKLYIRNAVSQPMTLPIIEEQQNLSRETLTEMFNKYKPNVVLTFGVQAFLLVLLASGEPLKQPLTTTKFLGEQFRRRIEKYDDHKVNVVPLLHASIARGKFLEAHRDFVGTDGQGHPNYFDYVGTKLADLLLAKLSGKPIWIE